MKCEKSVITMALHWHSSQVSSLGNCVDDTPTETGLMEDAFDKDYNPAAISM